MDKERIIEEINECPECGGSLEKDLKHGETICNNCGLVVEEEIIDSRPEKRIFDSNEEKMQHGLPMTPILHDKGLGTIIGHKNKGCSGKSIEIYRLKRTQRRSTFNRSRERNFAIASTEISRICSSLGLPRTIRERASTIYSKALTKNITQGRSIMSVAATTVYAACKEYNINRTLTEIEKNSGVACREIGRNFREIRKRLKLKIVPPSPKSYIPRFCSEMKLSQKVSDKAIEIVNQALKKDLVDGRDPAGIAGASIYIATFICGEILIQRKIARVVGVTEVTIRNRYHEISDRLGIDIDINNRNANIKGV